MRSQAVSAIRTALPGDVPQLVRLAARAFAEYDATAGRTVRAMMARPGACTFVADAEQPGTPIGFVVVEPLARAVLSVSAVAVSPAYRGRRVGERLMEAAERHARAVGAKRLALTTAEANVAALSLFLRVGFRISARHLVRYEGKEPACELIKVLT